MPLDSPNLLNGLDHLELIATGPGLNMEGPSADEQANPAFSMNALDILQFSQSIDSVSGTCASAGPASVTVASTSKSTVKNFQRIHVEKLKTAWYGPSQISI